MNKRMFLAPVFLLMMGAGAITPTRSMPSTRPAATTRPLSFEDNYLLILQRNIFSRTRTYVYSSSYTPTTQQSYSPQQSYVLTGVAEQGGDYVAFIENRGMNETQRYHVGDVIAGGKISRIGIDAIEFAVNGKPIRIEIGMSLNGLAPTTQSSYIAGSTTTTSGSSTSSGGGPSDILERLRQRRMQELKK